MLRFGVGQLQHLSPNSEVTSDGLACFRAIVEVCPHGSIMTGGGAQSMKIAQFKWVNTMLGNVKNALHGTYHAHQAKHLGRYLAEFCYRFNRRFDLAAMVIRNQEVVYGKAVHMKGSHDQLTRSSDLYQRLAKLQSGT